MTSFFVQFITWSSVLLLLAPWSAAVGVSRPAALTVTSPSDSGPGTLRQALLQAVSGDTITFSTTVFPPNSPITISPRSALPALDKDNITLNASNAGAILDGSLAPSGTDGLVIGADNCTVQGLTIQRFGRNGLVIAPGASGNTIGGSRAVGAGPNGQGNLIINNSANGVEVQGPGADNNLLRGNYLGIDRSGTWDAGNAWSGVALWNGARGNVIGGTSSSYRNVISGNNHNGVWIGGTGTDNNQILGNYLGTRADGLGSVPNTFSGVSIPDGARNNRIGGTASGAGNLISGNGDYGVYISAPGTSGNRVLGNLIGPDRTGNGVIGQGLGGVLITGGATGNIVGDGSLAGRNVISGNTFDGVHMEGTNTANNSVQGNILGANASGTAPLPNTLHGVELSSGAHDNQVGGNRLSGQGNLLSGNLNHGLVITSGAHHNTVAGNIVGPDITGSTFLGNQPFGGADISNGAHHNVIGGLTSGTGNLISGNPMDGIALFKSNDDDTTDNQLLGNIIGLTLDGSQPLPNGGSGIFNVYGASRTRIERNTIAYNVGYGVVVSNCGGNTVTANSIYANVRGGIRSEGNCVAPPMLRVASIGATEVVTGTTIANGRVEVFSDDDGQGRVYEGYTTADSAGRFSFGKPGGFAGPNLTATSTNTTGSTSEFSRAAHLSWTVLLYLNGDNDLEEYMFDTITNTVAAGASPQANVLALVDGYTTTVSSSGTVLYDLTWGQQTPLAAMRGESDMGDKKTLIDFVTWGRLHYPARHTMLAILDHGGGWAPSSGGTPTGPLPWRHHWLAGGSGLSWDFSSDFDYLDNKEMREAMTAITDDGDRPLDVVFYDVCLMGMVEVAYQIKDYASYFVSSQNIGWAPLGPDARYVRTIQGFTPRTTPLQLATLLVDSYADSLPEQEHPFTISAIDLAALPDVTGAASDLATAIGQTLTGPNQAAFLREVYSQAQKIDYDADFVIEPATDGFVDLYDFALKARQLYAGGPVSAAAQTLMNQLNLAVVAERHRSAHPWMAPSEFWNLDNAHGLSIFLPLGEDLELPVVVTDTVSLESTEVVTRHLRLRDMYTGDELLFVRDSAWKSLIDTYYTVVASPVPTVTTTGPISGMIAPDITPPRSEITLTGSLVVGQPIQVTWSATDAQSGVAGVTLWHRILSTAWVAVASQTGTSGLFSFTPARGGRHYFAVQATDRAGNVEPVENGTNLGSVFVAPARHYFPRVQHR